MIFSDNSFFKINEKEREEYLHCNAVKAYAGKSKVKVYVFFNYRRSETVEKIAPIARISLFALYFRVLKKE